MGVPSYVYPADILPNVEALAPCVDDIEILLFESEQVSAMPTPSTIESLHRIALDHDLTYTIHLPFDRKLGDTDRAERIAHQKQILKIMALTSPLNPFAYILHLEGIAPATDAASVKTWQDNIATLLPAIVAQAENPCRICIENLSYPFNWCDSLLERFGLGVCLDTGHLELSGGDVHQHFQRYADRIRVIHLHGVKDGRDHLALTALPPGRLRRLLNTIDKFTGVLTLEIFNYEEVRDSIVCLNQCNCAYK